MKLEIIQSLIAVTVFCIGPPAWLILTKSKPGKIVSSILCIWVSFWASLFLLTILALGEIITSGWAALACILIGPICGIIFVGVILELKQPQIETDLNSTPRNRSFRGVLFPYLLSWESYILRIVAIQMLFACILILIQLFELRSVDYILSAIPWAKNVYLIFFVCMPRCRDCAITTWSSALLLIPTINYVYMIALAFIKTVEVSSEKDERLGLNAKPLN